MNTARLTRLRESILANGLDGLALMPGPNLIYVSGIHSHVSERPVLFFLPVDDEPAIIIPTLEAMKARAAGIPEARIFAWSDDEGYMGAFQRACAGLELSDFLLGVESLHMRVLELELLMRYAPGLTTAHADPVLADLRLEKDREEIATMERAVNVAETAMERLLPRLKIGMTEKQIAAMLSGALIEAGADALAFPPIVSAGPNGASPHAVPTDRPLQAGDLLVIDWGAVVDDYPSDITRTFAVGDVAPELRRVYDIVRKANEAGKSVVRPGTTGQDVDRAARGVIAGEGLGRYFLHRTGHGLGLEVHEPPFMMEGNEHPMGPGTVFTVEPGIYLPGRGGVRIEDDIVVTPQGHRSLTTFTRDLLTVG
jgi:Xaa-Pro aminopeptidase